MFLFKGIYAFIDHDPFHPGPKRRLIIVLAQPGKYIDESFLQNVLGIFRMMAQLGFVDQPIALILAYGAFNMAFATWMLQSYFATIPIELEEAAWIDGATWWQSLRMVFLPLAVPALAVTAILTFVNTWNEFVLALTLLRSQDSYTLTIRIYSLVGAAYRINWDHVMAATLLATLPVAVIFAWLQRYMVRGLSLGAVK